MTIEKRATAGTIAGIAGLALNLAQSLLLVPLLLSFWSAETYGLWMGVGAVVALLISFDSGHQNYLGNILNRQSIENKAALAVTVRSGIRAAVVIAAFELLVGLAIIISNRLNLFTGIAGTSNSNVAGALVVNLVFWVLNGSIGGILVRLYVPAGLFAWSQWLGIIYRLAGFLAVIAAVAGGASILGAMLAQVLAWSACNLFTFWDLRRRFPEVHPWWRGGQWSLAWRNFRLSLVLTANGVVEQLASNGLILLVGRVLSPVSVALFTTVRTVANIGIQGANIMLNPLAPDLVRFHVTREGNKLAAVFSASWFAGTSMITTGLAVGVFVLEPVYALWTRGVLPLDRLLFAYLGAAVAVRQWAAPFQAYLASMNQLRPQSLMAVTRAVLGLGLAAVLLPRLGLPAAGLGAFAAETGAALVAAVAVRAQMHDMGASFPLKPAVLALGQIAISSVIWLLFAHGVQGRLFWAMAGLLLIALLAWWQWRALPEQVKSRLLGLLRFRTPVPIK